MKTKSKIVSALSLVSAVGVLAAVTTTREVRAGKGGCTTLKGTYTATFTANNCQSVAGLCATGTITGGLLDGATTFWSELNQAPSAGMVTTESSRALSYDGQMTITTPGGTLTVRDLGIIADVNFPTGPLSEIETPVSGTGAFATVVTTTPFYISGSLTNNGFSYSGELSGEICTP